MPSARQTLATFFEEKKLPVVSWDIVVDSPSGPLTHIIDSSFVQNLIVNIAGSDEQKKILDVIVRIDFMNGDVNHFLRHLAEGYCKQQSAG